MHISRLLHKAFMPASKNIDKRLHRSLLEAALTLTDCRHLSIAGIGRCLKSSSAVKHTIKRIDRLFGNQHLHQKRDHYYQMMVKLLVGSNPHPVILVDWSGLTRCGEYHFLRASVPVGGRGRIRGQACCIIHKTCSTFRTGGQDTIALYNNLDHYTFKKNELGIPSENGIKFSSR